MNTTGCPAGFATDQAFQPGTPLQCETSLIGFYLFIAIPVSLSFVTAVKQYSNWKRRQAHASKIPRGPLTQLLYASIGLITLPLMGLDYVNYSNGLSFSVMTLQFLPFAFAYSIGLLQLVSLGEKIIPKSKRPSREENGDATKLASFDNLGKVLFTFQSIFLILTSFFLVVLSPTLTQYEAVISRIGFGSKSLFMALTQCGYWYQFERCIQVIKSVRTRALESEKEAQATTSGRTAEEFESAIMRMRRHQLSHVGATPAVVIFFLLAIDAIPSQFWLIYATGWSQAISGFYFEFRVKAMPAKSNAPQQKISQKDPRRIENSQLQHLSLASKRQTDALVATSRDMEVDTPQNSQVG